MINPKRLRKIAIALKPATLLTFHKALVQRKYRLLFSNKTPKKPGPKGPSEDIIEAIVEMKQHDPRYGYRMIGTIRREILDQTLFWTAKDVENKLDHFQCYYNEERGHCGIEGSSPLQQAGEKNSIVISLNNY